MPKSIEHLMNREFRVEEYYDDSLCRAPLVAALKIAFWRKYPLTKKIEIVRIFTGLIIEIRAYYAYETLRFYTQFLPDSLERLNCTDLFDETGHCACMCHVTKREAKNA